MTRQFSEEKQHALYGFYTTPPKSISFEFFPPKTAQSEVDLWEEITTLSALNPHFVSVTYGAGGTTRERTHATIKRLIDETSLKPAAHLTCVGASRADIDAIATSYWDAGVRHIVALRGDAPDGKPYEAHPQGYAYASDLVEGLKKIGDFDISVAAYPEMHPQASSLQADIDHLKRKIDAGATRAITQFFFNPDIYLRFMDKVRAANITVPVIPGVLPVSNIHQLKKFAAMCGATVPDWMDALFLDIVDDKDLYQQTAAFVTASMCRRLRLEGVEEFHFYTLNRAMLTKTICHLLGVRPSVQYNHSA
jgi:methylenetetrahydrofolate reductase (NADPH)